MDENNRALLDAELSQMISRYEKGEITCVDFSKISSFKWDKLYIFRPYRSPQEIDNILGAFWLGSRFTSIASNDRITLLVFVQNGEVVQSLELSREMADFAMADNMKGYDFQKSCFIKNEQGQMVIPH
jgi:hypothetical protein